MIYKQVKIKPSLLKELKKEGLVSIEKIDPSNIKIITYDRNKKEEKENGQSNKNNNKNKLNKEQQKDIFNKKTKKKLICKNDKKKKKLKIFKKKKNIENKNIDHCNNLKKQIVKKNNKQLIEYKNKLKKNDIIKKEKKIFNIQKIIKYESQFKKLKEIDITVKKWKIGKNLPLYVILKSLHDNKFYYPYLIQSKTLVESIKNKKDIIVISKTGTGKTLSFALPILNNIILKKIKEYKKTKKSKSKLRALILVPTRELAIQILNNFEIINKYSNIYIINIIGGLNIYKQTKKISQKPEIIICTIGRLRFFLENETNISYINNMKHVRYFVCDELDKLFETSFKNGIKVITNHLYKCLGEKKKLLQTFLASATLGLTVHLENENLSNMLKIIQIRKEKTCIVNLTSDNFNTDNFNILPDNLILNIIKCEKKMVLLKLFYLLRYYFFVYNEIDNKINNDINIKNNYKQNIKIIVFVNTIVKVKELKELFSLFFFDTNLESNTPKKYKTNLSLKKKINIYIVHSKLIQKNRLENIKKFSESKNNSILFCTDILSRGIDLEKCDIIIQLNCPITDITFVHRSGRTARKFNKGLCICFITEEEINKWDKAFKKIGLNLKNLNKNKIIEKLKGEEYYKLNKSFNICNDIIKLQEEVKLKKKNFLNKLAEDAELDLNESSDENDYSDENEFGKKSRNDIFKKIKNLKIQLFNLLYSEK